jgi:hypothetical protein
MTVPPPASRRPGAFGVIVVLVLVVTGLVLLARLVPGPAGLRVTVVETGRVGTSKDGVPADLP